MGTIWHKEFSVGLEITYAKTLRREKPSASEGKLQREERRIVPVKLETEAGPWRAVGSSRRLAVY